MPESLVLLTRPERDNARLAEQLAERGIASLGWPLTAIVYGTDLVEVPDEIEAVIFTSQHGVTGFAERSDRCDLQVICVGTRTAEMARAAGFENIVFVGSDAQELIAHLETRKLGHAFYARGRDISVDLRQRAGDFGTRITEQIVYAAEPGGPPPTPVESALTEGRFGAITIWSRRNSELLAQFLSRRGEISLEGTTLVAISENAAEPLENARFRRIIISETPNANGMVSAVSAALR